jgi:hypothetical protein
MPKKSALKRWAESTREPWAPYVRQIADTLHLKDWEILISPQAPAGDETIASIQPIYGRKSALLRLSDGFLTDSATDQRHTLVHELIHCHAAPLQRLLESEEHMTAGARQAIEYCVDGLADAIAPLLPLPPANTRSKH